MKNKILNTIFIFLIVAALVWLAFYLAGNRALPEDANFNDEQNNEQTLNQAEEMELFEVYLRDNINEISPEPAVLGGTFYVTEIDLMSDGSALVSYEDGHIALKAIAIFSITDEQVVIESFEILPENTMLDPVAEETSDYKMICIDQCGNGVCEEMVCMGEGCPCPETPESCPIDCA
jgi:hypothetical protein